MKTLEYSVLMSVYFKEKAQNLRESMDSIWNQTLKTNDFVLVCDGPLSVDLDEVIDEMSRFHPELSVVRLEKNSGLGSALNIGIKQCRNEIVARMDSDDISRPDRCELQMSVFSSNPDVSICSGTVEEFVVSKDIVESKRVVPEMHDDIVKFAKKRNPFNHPCVMYKKTAVDNAGGYKDFYLLEDYYLWIRMLQNGAIGYNLQRPLLWMRAGSDLYKRRSGLRYAQSQKKLFKYMNSSGFISKREYIGSVLLRGAASLTPNFVRKMMFKAFLRKKA